MREKFGQFLSYYRAWHTLGNFLQGFTRSYGKHCANDKTISVTIERLLRTQFFEKEKLSFQKKKFGSFFSRVFEQ